MQDVLRKAAITTSTLSSGGILNTQQFSAFIVLITDYSKILSSIRVIPVTEFKKEIDKLDLGSPVTRAATEATEETTTSQPTLSKVTYETKKTVSAYDISTESEEDNIEGSSFRNTLVKSFTERIALDMADLCVNGDESLSGTDTTSLLRKTNDGLQIKTVVCPNIVDANGLGASLKLFKVMLNKMPVRWKGPLRNSLRWFIQSNPLEDITYEYGTRATTGGDSVYNELVTLRPFGIPFVECPEFPTDLTIGTAQVDGTFMLLCDPRNLMWFVQRKITTHFMFQPRKDLTEVTIYMRTDFEIENINAIVKARSVSCDASASYS